MARPEESELIRGLFVNGQNGGLSFEDGVIRHFDMTEGAEPIQLQRVVPVKVDAHQIDDEKLRIEMLVYRLEMGQRALAFAGEAHEGWGLYTFLIDRGGEALLFCRPAEGHQRAFGARFASAIDEDNLESGCDGRPWEVWQYVGPDILERGLVVNNAGEVSSQLVLANLNPYPIDMTGQIIEVEVGENNGSFVYPQGGLLGTDQSVILSNSTNGFESVEPLLRSDDDACKIRLRPPGELFELDFECPAFRDLPGTRFNPAESCDDLLAERTALGLNVDDGQYWLLANPDDGQQAQFFCDMTTEYKGRHGGWTELLTVLPERMNECPRNWIMRRVEDQKFCTRPREDDPDSGSQGVVEIPLSRLRFSEVQIRATLHQFGAPDAFHPPSARFNLQFVDGLSIILGSYSDPYHVWTYAVATSTTNPMRSDIVTIPDAARAPSLCPQRPVAVPQFAQDAYSCGSAYDGIEPPADGFFGGAPLFADEVNFVSLSVETNGPLWAILMADEGIDEEDILVKELRVRVR